MLRQQLLERYERAARSKKFRNREISRLEGLSDAVFGFAITLLIVSLEVPKTSADLIETMRGFFAFALTFLILFSIWHRQFTYFRRYGLEDNVSIALNGALLFMVLFFVYPLKFISSMMVRRAMGGGKSLLLPNGSTELIVRPEHLPWLFGIYGLGFTAVFGLFALLYRHALTKRDELGLNDLEIFDTRQSIHVFTMIALLGVLVSLSGWGAALEAKGGAWRNISYLFLVADTVAIVMLVRMRMSGRRHRRAIESISA